MAMKIVDNFNISKQAPLDSRSVFGSVDEALEKINIYQRYDGLIVYIKSEESYYRFTGGINDEDFILVTSDKPAKHSTYIHIQAVPSKVWTISHNLEKFPSTTTVDSAGTTVYGVVSYPDDKTVIVEFSSEFSGKAYLN